MYLLIDMSIRDSIHLALFNADSREDKVFEGRNRELLFCIDQLVKSRKLKVESEEIEGIIVVVGAGSFTSTRIACVVANTFAYVKQIPLLAILIERVDQVQELIPELLKQPKGQYISATYSGEPNLGKKKI
ncbi:MAG TPA: hypothetical protein DCS29_03295 [Candidatus Magasanikbacteria bacterium]|nr:MAG: hypothetical protein A2479_02895 [Candidatus Magasanikbacteria bacterium RIFOXYC2_FULL_39_8]HAT03771.1 hypothetical protein [Candidatus Magasanikbacteria bacterium]